MINWIDQKKEYNPIREHIKLAFNVVFDSSEMVKTIVKDLKDQNFDELKSRVLIFVRTRNQAEEAAFNLNKCLEDNQLSYAGKADFYHAGLEGADRAEKYENYSNGNTVILVATKAFGMGMDIKNIHFIFHLGPSSTFEDFLQEVGRAGRNADSLEEAGYSEANPLQAKCLITKDDFNKIKDLQHDSQITWSQIEQVRETIFDYIANFRPLEGDKGNAFPLPLDLLDQYMEYEEILGKDTFFRVILYWLERLDRIKLGVYTPSQLPIKILSEEGNFAQTNSREENEQLKSLLSLLLQIKKKQYSGSERIMADMQFLKDSLNITTTTNLFKLLFAAQKSKLIILDRNIKLECSVNRTPELKSWKTVIKSPRIDALFEFARRILLSTKPGNQIALDNQTLNDYINEVINLSFLPENIIWKEIKKNNVIESNEVISLKLIEDFKKTRSKFAFKLISFLPNFKYKSHIEYENEKAFITQLIYNGNRSNEGSKQNLESFKIDLIKFINFISKENLKNDTKIFNIVALINVLGIEDKGDEYFQKLVFISKGLGYLKGGGNLIPMGIELFINDIEKINVISEKDARIKAEFDESNKMKELRLLALKCLTNLREGEHDSFIKKYFKCAGLKDLTQLLIENLDENHPDLAAFREEALSEAKNLLNGSQRKVYETSISRNLQVIAGPGTGKTHTLTLRVARLIQEEKINPENILVLAYNRAVVVELKERLSKLFQKLGYFKLIKKLKIFTFHGFIKYSLGAEIDGLEFVHWTPKFLEIMNNSPGTIGQKLGVIKYVFIDEFQDITSERMELLKFIANPNKTKVCVIGDPNQSIYGYERANLGGPMDPQSYYAKFKEIYKPVEQYLNINYRSYSEILSEAERLLNLNSNLVEMPRLLANNKSISSHDKVELIDFKQTKVDWKAKLKELLEFEDENGTYKQVAVMFRSNNEVYRAFNILKDININVRIRIQGSKGSLNKTREFHELITILKTKGTKTLPPNYIDDFLSLKTNVLLENPRWDEYILDVFHCIIYEFNKEKYEDSTYEDLIMFIDEIGGTDDGQFGKIYQQNIVEIKDGYVNQEVVLTTMHKVKGLEFDAVLIPPSFSNLPSTSSQNHRVPLEDYIEEERRLYYVAYSRAKRKLVVIKYERENALELGESYRVPPNVLNKLGIAVNEGIDKFTMYWSASDYGLHSFNDIKNSVSIGDKIVLRPTINNYGTFWYAYINNKKIAALSKQFSSKISHLPEVNGFIVSYIYVHSYEESLKSDKKNGTNFSEKWNQVSQHRGYTYLIDFSGYGF